MTRASCTRCAWNAFLLPLALAAAACGRGAPGEAVPARKTISVAVVQPERADIVRRISLPGSAQAWEQVMVYVKVGGYLRAIHVDRGDTVRTGQLIAEIEIPELADEVAQQEATVAEVESALAMARDHYTRLSMVKTENPDAVTPAEIEAAASQRQSAEARVRMARAAYERSRSMQAYTQITAPISGVVGQRFADQGSLVQAAASSPLVSLYSIDRLRVIVDVPELDALGVSVGNGATIQFDALPNRTFEGRVGRFSGALDSSTRTLRVEIDLANPHREILPGLFGHVRLDLETHKDVLTIPAAALVMEKQKRSVFVVGGESARKVNVRTGADDGIRVEVLEGLSGAESVVVEGWRSLSDGAPVTVAKGAGS